MQHSNTFKLLFEFYIIALRRIIAEFFLFNDKIKYVICQNRILFPNSPFLFVLSKFAIYPLPFAYSDPPATPPPPPLIWFYLILQPPTSHLLGPPVYSGLKSIHSTLLFPFELLISRFHDSIWFTFSVELYHFLWVNVTHVNVTPFA